MAAKTTDWRPGPTVCRCCLSEGCYKDISTEYFWMGKREVYSEMLLSAFNLTISYSQSGGPNSNSRLICEPCISRLRDASDFKRQVQECEKTFMQYIDPGMSSIGDAEVPEEQLETQVKVEQVKEEKMASDDDFDDRGGFDDDDDDDLDDQPLTKLASKVPKKESVDLLDLLDNAKAAVKRKSTTKTKVVPAKKSKTTKKEVKPTSSSKTLKIEKMKKEPGSLVWARRNAETVLQYSTAYPFRLQGNVLICVYCRESYEDPSEYRQHLNDSHEKFTVATAFAHFQNNNNYLKVDVTDLKCRVCLEPYDDLNVLAAHIYDYHDSNKLDLNYEVALQPYKLNKGNWECYVCHKKLSSIGTLTRHTIAHYLKFTCDTCGKSYYTGDALKCHIKNAHSGKHICRRCRQDFPSEELRKEHYSLTKYCWAYCCVRCGDRFKSSEMKYKHMAEVHNCPQKIFECAYCDAIFASRSSFREHYNIQHCDKNFVCSFCGIKFKDKSSLEDHKLGHTGEKSFECSVCLKSFSRKKNLKQHLWIHRDKKRFVCIICAKQFAQKVGLKCHMKSHHPDVEVIF